MSCFRGFKRTRLEFVYQITGERSPASMEHAQSFGASQKKEYFVIYQLSLISMDQALVLYYLKST